MAGNFVVISVCNSVIQVTLPLLEQLCDTVWLEIVFYACQWLFVVAGVLTTVFTRANKNYITIILGYYLLTGVACAIMYFAFNSKYRNILLAKQTEIEQEKKQQQDIIDERKKHKQDKKRKIKEEMKNMPTDEIFRQLDMLKEKMDADKKSTISGVQQFDGMDELLDKYDDRSDNTDLFKGNRYDNNMKY